MSTVVRQTSSLAVVSLVCGILGWTVLPFLGSLAAIITGHMARAEIRRNPAGLDGDGLALAGLIMGWLLVAFSVLGPGDRVGLAADPEDVAAAGDLHAQAQFDLAQVLLERAGEVGQPLGVGRVEGEIVMDGSGHGAHAGACGAGRTGAQRVARGREGGQAVRLSACVCN